jgi:aspartate aminotransferase
VEFTEMLAEHDVFVMPGTVCEIPGYFRISLTASDEMIDRSLDGFRTAIERAMLEHSPAPELVADLTTT